MNNQSGNVEGKTWNGLPKADVGWMHCVGVITVSLLVCRQNIFLLIHQSHQLYQWVIVVDSKAWNLFFLSYFSKCDYKMSWIVLG